MPEFYLASKSPRRSDLLSMVGADFEVISSDANEDIEKLSPSETVRILSVRKAEGALSYKKDENALIIASDTVVSLDGVILPLTNWETALGVISSFAASSRWVMP